MLPYLTLRWLTHPYRILSYFTQSYKSYLTLSHLILPCISLPLLYLTLLTFALPTLTLQNPVLPFKTLPYLTESYCWTLRYCCLTKSYWTLGQLSLTDIYSTEARRRWAYPSSDSTEQGTIIILFSNASRGPHILFHQIFNHTRQFF